MAPTARRAAGSESAAEQLRQVFLNLALKANPNVLECLYSPLIEHVTPLGREPLQVGR